MAGFAFDGARHHLQPATTIRWQRAMGTRAKTTGQTAGKNAASVRGWVRRAADSGRFLSSAQSPSVQAADYRPETVARIKRLAESPSAGVPMTGDDFLKWLDR